MLPFFLQPKLGLEKPLWVHTTKLAPNISCASDEIREQQLGKRDHNTEQWIMHKDPISNSGMLVLPGTFKAFPNLFHCRQQSCGGVTVMPFHHLSIDRRKYDRRHTSSKWLLDFSCCSLVSELSLFFFLFPCFFFELDMFQAVQPRNMHEQSHKFFSQWQLNAFRKMEPYLHEFHQTLYI